MKLQQRIKNACLRIARRYDTNPIVSGYDTAPVVSGNGKAERFSSAFCRLSGESSGFTLIEMMIVVAIIGMLMGLVGLNVIKKFDEARVETTKNQIRSLDTILQDFKRVCGNYPTTEQGLDALVHKENAPNCKNYEPDGFMKKLPKDAWNNDFTYQSDGNGFEIKSLGSDGKEGGDGTGKDISSKDL